LAEPLARALYHTLHERVLALPDEVAVYPTHGAGSFCAAPGGLDRTTTIGRERAHNPLAQLRDEDAFVVHALSELPDYPVYYRYLRPINQRGPRLLRGLPAPQPLAPAQVRAWMDAGGAVLDVRAAAAFAGGHSPAVTASR
jgi:hypothetical protein